MTIKHTLFFTILLAFLLGSAFTLPQDQKKGPAWDIPTTYKSKKNSEKPTDESLKIGKALYAKHCRSCHGNTGTGDGPKSKNLETWPGDFTSESFQKGTDGELYFKSIIGRDEMPNFEKNIPDEESRWAVINYIRTLKK
jgi:mono/diheme cytochrome c family protein